MLSALTSQNSQNGVLDLISVMADPEKFRTQLEQMRTLQAQLDEKIAIAGKADEIIAIRAGLEGELAKSRQECAAAEQSAKELVAKANKKAQTIEVNANAKLVEAEKTASALLAQVQQDAKVLLDSHKEAMDKANAAIALRNQELDAATAENDKVLIQINQKQAKLTEQLATFEALRKEHNDAVSALAKEKEIHLAKVKRLHDSWNGFVKQAL